MMVVADRSHFCYNWGNIGSVVDYTYTGGKEEQTDTFLFGLIFFTVIDGLERLNT